MNLVHELLTKLQHVDPLVWAALLGYLAPYGQELLKQVRDFSARANYLVALVVLPAVVAALTGALQPDTLAHVSPLLRGIATATLAGVIGQLKYGLSLNPHLQLKAQVKQLQAQLPAPVDSSLPEGPIVNAPTAADY